MQRKIYKNGYPDWSVLYSFNWYFSSIIKYVNYHSEPIVKDIPLMFETPKFPHKIKSYKKTHIKIKFSCDTWFQTKVSNN